MPSQGLRIPHGALVVVADHRKALLLRNEGEVMRPALRKCRTVELPDSESSQGSEVTFGRFNKSSRTLVRDYRDANMRSEARARFARHLIEVLRDVVKTDRIEGMVIVATPHLLGEIRDRLDPHLRRIVIAEVARDLVHLPIRDIAARLTE
ncbi:hypothetical protein ASF65_04010 [Aureimonas sp. Leaf324]|jgi:protein required for attachment to host cells|nr:hypothetical protein ASF65_04010 [Aureimonas sp. Leaf324]